MSKKILILGHGRHGKDTVAEILRDNHGMSFESSSSFSSRQFIFDSLKNVLGYKAEDECFNDRHNYRNLWFELISAYNSSNPSRLATEMLDVCDIYVGMRNIVELECCIDHKLFDLILWVDASERVDYKEPLSSMNITKDMADIIIDNNGSLDDLKVTINNFIKENEHV